MIAAFRDLADGRPSISAVILTSLIAYSCCFCECNRVLVAEFGVENRQQDTLRAYFQDDGDRGYLLVLLPDSVPYTCQWLVFE